MTGLANAECGPRFAQKASRGRLRKGEGNRLIFAMGMWFGCRQGIGRLRKSGVTATAVHDASAVWRGVMALPGPVPNVCLSNIRVFYQSEGKTLRSSVPQIFVKIPTKSRKTHFHFKIFFRIGVKKTRRAEFKTPDGHWPKLRFALTRVPLRGKSAAELVVGVPGVASQTRQPQAQ